MEKAQRAEARAVKRQANMQRHEERQRVEKQALAALQSVNRAKRAAYFEKVTRKRTAWLQALHEDSKSWIAESEIDAVSHAARASRCKGSSRVIACLPPSHRAPCAHHDETPQKITAETFSVEHPWHLQSWYDQRAAGNTR